MEEGQQSEFNMAGAYMTRLHILLVRCDECSTGLDAFNWYHSLTAVFRELSPEMKKEDIEKYLNTLQQLNNLVTNENNSSTKRIKTGISNELYFELQDLEIQLRKLMSDRGLYNKVSKDPTKAVYG